VTTDAGVHRSGTFTIDRRLIEADERILVGTLSRVGSGQVR
jgi:hypothetical protein